MRTISLEAFRAECKAQAKHRNEIVFRCVMCGTLQCAEDLISAGAGADFEAVEPYLGFSCIGRWLQAGPPRKAPDGAPCNWTLGGLFRLHQLEVETPDGQKHPRFELATAEDAAAHLAARPKAAA